MNSASADLAMELFLNLIALTQYFSLSLVSDKDTLICDFVTLEEDHRDIII